MNNGYQRDKIVVACHGQCVIVAVPFLNKQILLLLIKNNTDHVIFDTFC